MRRDGYGFSFDVNPKFKQPKGKEQTNIRLHPDGGEKGTHGCIGVCEPARATRDFVQRMKDYSKHHKSIEMRVNDRTQSSPSTHSTGETNPHASTPTAAGMDFQHQGTGVPSQSPEAVNFAPGRQ